VYAGSGEANIRGNVAFGTGIFKSSDAGKSWKQVWKGRGQIGTMAVDPKNADIAFAAGARLAVRAGQGSAASTAPRTAARPGSRCCPRTRTPGASDVAFDPNNPRILFAGHVAGQATAVAHHQRRPRQRALPLGRRRRHLEAAQARRERPALGRMGQGRRARRASNSNRVYALIEAKEGGLFRSDDGGANFERVNRGAGAAAARLVLHLPHHRPDQRGRGVVSRR
jgi:hypothetical protein